MMNKEEDIFLRKGMEHKKTFEIPNYILFFVFLLLPPSPPYKVLNQSLRTSNTEVQELALRNDPFKTWCCQHYIKKSCLTLHDWSNVVLI